MSLWLSHGLLTLYYGILGVLALYGSHRLLLLALYYRHGRRPLAAPPAPAQWPAVTVQLPLFNELYVAERLVEAVCAFDYPRDRLEIQVLDDSTDETTPILAAAVARFRRAGFAIHHLRRRERRGYKAGALAAGLVAARGELLAVFDADFLPAPDFLRRMVPWFADPAVGMVQARWEHLNRDSSLLTRIQAIFLDGHFLVEHTARHRSGRFFNFNGTAGVFRRQAILDAGGWEHDTLTEDLDLSYRAQLAGWRFVFLADVAAPAELPGQIDAFKRQQFRWAKGSMQTARKLLGRLLAAPLPLAVRLEALVHLTSNGTYLLMVLLSLLIFPAMLARRAGGLDELWRLDLPLFLAATASVCGFYLVSQRAQGRGAFSTLATLPALMALGIGLSVNNCRAVIEGFRQRGGVFERTPKLGTATAGGAAARAACGARRGYAVRRGASFAVEGALAGYFVLCVAVAVALEMWLALPFLVLFLQGYTYIFLLSALGRGGPWPRPGRGRIDLGEAGGAALGGEAARAS